MTARRLQKKIVLLGDPAVGKTSLIQNFVYGVFDDRYLATFGAKITKKSLIFPAVQYPDIEGIEDTELLLLVWDIAGQKAFKTVHQAYYRGAEAAIIVCDVTRPETLQHVPEWVNDLYEAVGKVPIILLVNKCDLTGQVRFGDKEIAEIISQFGIYYYFSSAKTGHNVEDAFKTLSEFIIGARK